MGNTQMPVNSVRQYTAEVRVASTGISIETFDLSATPSHGGTPPARRSSSLSRLNTTSGAGERPPANNQVMNQRLSMDRSGKPQGTPP